MCKGETSVLLKAFYRVFAPLLVYEPCEETVGVERSVLELLCEVRDERDLLEDCLRLVEEARCLQIASDGLLPSVPEESTSSVAFDLKKEILIENKIVSLKVFDARLFAEALKEDAGVGEPGACSLLAALSWLGVILPQNKTAALNLWSALAVYGDPLSLRMLVYAYKREGRTEQAVTWSHVFHILRQEQESFSAVALCSDHAEYGEREVQLANLILCVRQRRAERKENLLNRSMAHYLLHSADDYQTKMTRLTAPTNYYLAMYLEDTYANKEYGFS